MKTLTVCINLPESRRNQFVTGLIQKTNRYESEIIFTQENRSVNGKSLLGVLSIGFGSGGTYDITINGRDEVSAASELKAFLQV